jgi:NADH-quinone oxidoreductase subunit J
MPLDAIAFYVFSAIAIAAGLGVVSSRNPVHSVLFLILAFFSAAGLFVLLGAEFLAMLLIVVYVGAVAVLFLFVVMMLDIDFAKLKAGFLNYLPVGAIVAAGLLVELVLVGLQWKPGEMGARSILSPTPEGVPNAQAIGRILYTDYILLFQLAGVVLFIAMVGAIVLTLRRRPGVRKQSVSKQVGRRRDEGVENIDVKPGQGLL